MEYHLTEKAPFRIIGRRAVTPYGGGTWAVARQDGTVHQLELMEPDTPLLGACFGFGADGSNDYMVAVISEKQQQGLEEFHFPKAQWLCCTFSGAISQNILGKTWEYLNCTLLPQLSIQKASLPTLEIYREWDTDKDFCSMEIQIPYLSK